jgi:hypothetical protein
MSPEPRVRPQDDTAEPSEPIDGDEAEQATRLLFGASQNIWIAAEASKLAAAAVRSASSSSGYRQTEPNDHGSTSPRLIA